MELEEIAIAAALLGLGSDVVRILETAKLVQLETAGAAATSAAQAAELFKDAVKKPVKELCSPWAGRAHVPSRTDFSKLPEATKALLAEAIGRYLEKKPLSEPEQVACLEIKDDLRTELVRIDALAHRASRTGGRRKMVWNRREALGDMHLIHGVAEALRPKLENAKLVKLETEQTRSGRRRRAS